MISVITAIEAPNRVGGLIRLNRQLHEKGGMPFEHIIVVDGNKETYWATDDDITRASVEIYLDKPDTVNYIVLQEYIKLGQRVKAFSVDAWISGTSAARTRARS